MTNYRHVSPDVIAAALKGTKQMIKTQHCPNCEATKQELSDFRQEVSDAVGGTLFMVETHCDGEAVALVSNRLMRFIIPALKPDPLVEVLHEVDTGPEWDSPEDYCNKIRAALDACGYEIRAKNDDQ